MKEANEGISANTDGTYVVKKGDYLDKIIINSTVGNYPFKRDVFLEKHLFNPIQKCLEDRIRTGCM